MTSLVALSVVVLWPADPAAASTWSLSAVPVPAGMAGALLQGVSCTATSVCTAVGTSYASSGDQFPLAEGWDGTGWSVQSTPAFGNGGVTGLLGVSCVSAAWCMAVGGYDPVGSNVPSTLAEMWDGSDWVIVPSPSPGPGGPDAELDSVSCVSASACMAIGDSNDGSFAGLAEQWDGSSWSVVPVPEPAGTSFARLFGVSCTAAGDCTAVGVVNVPGETLPLMERWDGSAWSIESAAVPSGTNESSLKSVSCVAASACTAAGLETVSGDASLTLVEAWDGSAWSIEPTPNPGTADDGFGGVSCASGSVCTAVGAPASGSTPEVTLAEGWDGTAWSAQSTPAPSNATSDLFATSCLAASWCQAVGLSQLNSGGYEQPLAEIYSAGSTPSVSTLASGGVPLGGQVSATTTVSGGEAPSGSVTFRLYGPNDASCSSVPVFTSTVPVSGDGSYGSGSFTPATGETYRWTATYSGDQSNNPASSGCGAKGGTVIVSRLNIGLATSASGTVPAGAQVSDTASLSGGLSPSRWIRFRLYGPGDTTCSGAQVFTSRVPVSGDGSYPSGSATLTVAGTYRWTAEYPGDLNNNAASEGCGATGEVVTVTKATPALDSTASGSVPLGRKVEDVAALSGAEKPTGSITFNLYAPGDSGCTHPPVFTATVTINRNASYSSGLFGPAKAGTYRFTAAYSGDANNAPASEACGATGEQVTIT